MRLLFSLAVVLIASINVNAAEVFLSDGSIVVGTLVSLAGSDDLIVDTEHMGEVAIEHEAVKEIRSTKVIDVELFNGQRRAATGSDLRVRTGPRILLGRADYLYGYRYEPRTWQ